MFEIEWIQRFVGKMRNLVDWWANKTLLPCEQCMPKSASLDANFRGESVTIHAVRHQACKRCPYRTPDASQRSSKRRVCRWAAGDARARQGTSAVLFAVRYAHRIRELPAPNSTRAPASSRVCTQTAPELSAGTCAPAQHNAMCHVFAGVLGMLGVLGVLGVQRPAKRSWRIQRANRRVLALRGRRAQAPAPTAGCRGASSCTWMCSMVRAGCIRCAWRLRSS